MNPASLSAVEVIRANFLVLSNILAQIGHGAPQAEALIEVTLVPAFWLKSHDAAWYTAWRSLDVARDDIILDHQVLARMRERMM